jgi:hypothetical protein
MVSARADRARRIVERGTSLATTPPPRAYWQMLAQLEVEMPLAEHERKHASRGDSLAPQFEHRSIENPQIERHDDVLKWFAMHES